MDELATGNEDDCEVIVAQWTRMIEERYPDDEDVRHMCRGIRERVGWLTVKAHEGSRHGGYGAGL